MPILKYAKILCCQTVFIKIKIKASCSHRDFQRISKSAYSFLDIL